MREHHIILCYWAIIKPSESLLPSAVPFPPSQPVKFRFCWTHPSPKLYFPFLRLCLDKGISLSFVNIISLIWRDLFHQPELNVSHLKQTNKMALTPNSIIATSLNFFALKSILGIFAISIFIFLLFIHSSSHQAYVSIHKGIQLILAQPFLFWK